MIYLPVLVLLMGACSGKGSKSGSGMDMDMSQVSSDTAAGVTQYMAETDFPAENLKIVRLDVRGMTCTGCEKAIVTSISKLDGIQEASASHTAAEATVRYDSTQTGIADISRAIADAGYSVAGEKSPDRTP